MSNIIAQTATGVFASENIVINNTRNSRFPISIGGLNIAPTVSHVTKQHLNKGLEKSVEISLSGSTDEDSDWLKRFAVKDHLEPRFAGKKLEVVRPAPNKDVAIKVHDCDVEEATRRIGSPASEGQSEFIKDQRFADKIAAAGGAVQKKYDAMIEDVKNGREKPAIGAVRFDTAEQWEAEVEEKQAMAGQSKSGGRRR